MGLREQAQQLLNELTEAVTDNQQIDKFLSKPALNRGVVYPALLRLASGWLYFGDSKPAEQVLAVVRSEVLDGSLSPQPRNLLATAYAQTLGHAPVEMALNGFSELFERLSVGWLDFTQGTIQRLRLIEAVVLSMATEDFTADNKARRWLDDEELLIRRRIHEDVRSALKQAGL